MATTSWEVRRVAGLADVFSLAKPRVTVMVVLSMLGGRQLSGAPWTGWSGVGLVVGVLLLVASANTLNCYLERDSDAWMERTRDRALPSGRLRPETAWWAGWIMLGASIPLLAGCSNARVMAMGLLAHGLYVAAYTPMKRRSAWSLLAGAVPGALPPWMGWVAARGTLDLPGAVLFLTLLLWQVPHTLAIGIYRQHEYRAAHLRVVPHVLRPGAVQALLVTSALALWGISLLPAFLGTAGPVFGLLALLGGGGFVARCLRRGALSRELHGRHVFRATLVHLLVLILAMALDHP